MGKLSKEMKNCSTKSLTSQTTKRLLTPGRFPALSRARSLAAPARKYSVLALKLLEQHDALPSFMSDVNIIDNNAAYTGFSFAMSFLFVFRTSNAYSRFWEGSTDAYRMYAEWMDFVS